MLCSCVALDLIGCAIGGVTLNPEVEYAQVITHVLQRLSFELMLEFDHILPFE
jgi:hypothetical protein